MRRHFISEKTAINAIYVLTAAVFLGFLVFWWSAHSFSQIKPLLDEVRALPNQLELLAQVNELEQQLENARKETTSAKTQKSIAEKESEIAKREADRLTTTSLELLDSLKLDYVGEFYATAYCCERYPHICGGNGVTASGTAPTPGLTVAADWSVLPSGTWLYIEGVGMRRVEDTGSAIKGKRLDIAIDTHANALRWSGQGNHHVWVLNWDK